MTSNHFDSFPKRFSVEDTAAIVAVYKANPSPETVASLAELYGRSIASIVAKLSYERVYVSEKLKAKTSKPHTKTRIDYVREIAEHLGLEASSLIGLEKANLQTLVYIAEGFERFAQLNATEFSPDN